MRFFIFLSFITFHSYSISSEVGLEEEIVFQDNSISQNNLISEISTQEELAQLINNIEYNDNFFYALFDPLTNSNIFPKYSNQLDFFLEKLELFDSKHYEYQLNSNIFEKILFEDFASKNANQSYLTYLFNSNQIMEMCSYLSQLNENQKDFKDSIQYKILCLLEKEQYSQISLLLEIYDEEDISALNSNFLINFLLDKTEEKEKDYYLSNLNLLDRYIVLKDNNLNVNIDQISNLIDLEIYLSNNKLYLYQINNLFKKRVISVQQYISLLKFLDEKPIELKVYEDISSEINYNKKLKILEQYIPLVQLDLYDLSRLVNEQFSGMRITSRNLNYLNALMLLSLYENSKFLENLISVLKDIPSPNIEENFYALSLKFYLNGDFKDDYYIDDNRYLNSPLMKFLFLNDNLKFSEGKNDEIVDELSVSIDPVYLFHLSENFNLLASYSYYLKISEKYYNINEYDLYFLNKYLIKNEYLENELIKLMFKVHLSSL